MSILMIFVGIIAGYLFYSQTLKGQAIDIAPLPIREQDGLTDIINKVLDFSVLDNSSYRALRVFGEVPVNPGITGRVNIFDPY